MQRVSRDIVIPADLFEFFLSGELSLMEVHLYSDITFFDYNGQCFASNEYFARGLNVTARRIQQLLQSLKDKGFIKIDLIYKLDSKEVEKRIITPLFVMAFSKEGSRKKRHEVTKKPSGGYEETFVNPHEETYIAPYEESFVDNKEYINKENITKSIKINNIEQKPAKGPSSSELQKEFEALWKVYPRKIGKKKAFDSFKKARKVKKIPYETIQSGLYRYIKYLEAQEIEEQFVQHGSTWFNQEKWQDEYSSVQTKRKPKNAFEYYQMEYGGQGDESNRNGEVIDYYSEVVPESFQGF